MDSPKGGPRLHKARSIFRFKFKSTSFSWSYSYPNSHPDILKSMFLNLVLDQLLLNYILKNADFWALCLTFWINISENRMKKLTAFDQHWVSLCANQSVSFHCAHTSPGDLVKMQVLSDSLDLGWGLRVCISNKPRAAVPIPVAH